MGPDGSERRKNGRRDGLHEVGAQKQCSVGHLSDRLSSEFFCEFEGRVGDDGTEAGRRDRGRQVIRDRAIGQAIVANVSGDNIEPGRAQGAHDTAVPRCRFQHALWNRRFDIEQREHSLDWGEIRIKTAGIPRAGCSEVSSVRFVKATS